LDFCGYKHTLPAAAQGFMVEYEGDIDVAVGPSVRGVFNAIVHSVRYLLNIFEIVTRAYDLKLQPEIEEIAGQLVAAADTILQNSPEVCE
jgi:hypothetical protein